MKATVKVCFSIALVCSTVAVGRQAACAQHLSADGTAGGAGLSVNRNPALTGERHPQYRLQKSDVVEVRFTFSPEYDQVLTVQPDGFVALKGVRAVFAEGLTSGEFASAARSEYAAVLRDPEITVSLKDFERPFFLAGGQVGKPGKYELRSSTTVSEAIAVAGGFTEQAKHSQVLLFRRADDGLVETRVLNVKQMLAAHNLNEDLELKPGDMLYVPQNRISKIRKFLPASSLNTFFSPTQF